ncbi:DUF742 domain-containing protein [Streptomyces sp. TRM 70361]|uniref:DUF742 domain-containing protein n=1 Tax=Streptomyces sp. TRM 70361 TaxID=3116553 RepID=UPI002E7BE9A8|nr:DUF742 domain-containing protein [Streptomyces sp. TRM 70361]MEE1943162.1 DUF742 domain-containing protein [Streptomyces sp. TRM 70361]
MTDRWFDDAAGPVVRPYAMTRGRTHSAGGDRIDPVALVVVDPGTGADPSDLPVPVAGAPGGVLAGRAPGPGPVADDRVPGALEPEHLAILARCLRSPQPVASLADGLDLPVGVVRVLVGDLVEARLARVTRPVPRAEPPDERVLREVIAGLRAL